MRRAHMMRGDARGGRGLLVLGHEGWVRLVGLQRDEGATGAPIVMGWRAASRTRAQTPRGRRHRLHASITEKVMVAVMEGAYRRIVGASREGAAGSRSRRGRLARTGRAARKQYGQGAIETQGRGRGDAVAKERGWPRPGGEDGDGESRERGQVQRAECEEVAGGRRRKGQYIARSSLTLTQEAATGVCAGRRPLQAPPSGKPYRARLCCATG